MNRSQQLKKNTQDKKSKRVKKRPLKSSPSYDYKRISHSKSLHIVLGCVLSAFSLYLAFSILSFFITGGIDQSLAEKGFWKLTENPEVMAANYAGKLGAWLSNILINNWFGIPSILFVYILAIISINIFSKGRIKNMGRKIIITLALIIWASLFFGYISKGIMDILNINAGYLFPGGAHGYFVSIWLNALIGRLGSFILILLTFIIILYFGFQSTFFKVVEAISREIKKQKERKLKLKENLKNSVENSNSTVSNNSNDKLDHETNEKLHNETNEDLENNESYETRENTSDELENNASDNISDSLNNFPHEVGDNQNSENNENNISDFDKTQDNEARIINLNIDSKTNSENGNGENSLNKDTLNEDSLNKDTLNDDTLSADELSADASNKNSLNEDALNEDATEDKKAVLTINKKTNEEKVRDNIPQVDYDPTLDLSHYKYPTLSLLLDHAKGNSEVEMSELKHNQEMIIETLRNFNIEIVKIKATIGPTITLYEIIPAPGVRIAKIKNLEDDIALSLSALGIRIIAPIPGSGTIGIEVPNNHPGIVSMNEIIASKKFQESKFALPVALGKNISNETYTFDLAKMPHLLVAGATGQGKSVGLNAIIVSLLYKKHPSQLKFVMVDPKKVELSIYSIIEKHFLAKLPGEEDAIITETDKVIATLNSLCVEMDNRYDLLKKAYVRNIKEYNKKFVKRQLNPENGHKYLPYIVVVVDEFADLIMTAGKDIEQPIARIAQLARAVGIHMIIATQRPSTNIITGIIKANFPARIAFKVASMIDSRTILDATGANQLIGRGDMLISVDSKVTRVQCAFVDTPEVEQIVKFIASQQAYISAYELPEVVEKNGDKDNNNNGDRLSVRDELFDNAARMVVSTQQGSTSNIQRRFGVGFNRAGRIMDQLEAAGIVGPAESGKPRQVYIQDESILENILLETNN